MAKGYWVTIYEEISDPLKLAAYAASAGPAISQYSGRFIIRGGASVAKEGLPTSRTVVVEFDSFEQAQAAYDSTVYRAALAKLDGAVKRHLRIVEGL